MSLLLTRLPRHGPAVACALMLAILTLTARAQSPNPTTDREYKRTRAFPMPFTVDADKRAGIRELKLYVVPEQGKDWELNATMTPAQTRLDPRSGLHVREISVQVSRDRPYN